MDKILIIEDSRAQAEYLKSILAADYEVAICLTGEEGFRMAKAEAFSLIFLDIIMPDVNGFTLLKNLQETLLTKYTPVILVSGLADVQHEEKGLTLGAVDYITKPFNILEVKARIKAIMRRTGKRGSSQVNDKVIVKGSMKIDCESRRVVIGEREINLTAKEFDLLELLAMNPNKVYSRENLLNIVWGYEYPGDARTVDVHIRRLREKIETNPSDPKYVYTKWGVGYYFRG